MDLQTPCDPFKETTPDKLINLLPLCTYERERVKERDQIIKKKTEKENAVKIGLYIKWNESSTRKGTKMNP